MPELPWEMPEWMEPYRESISNTGGNSIEDLMNDTGTSVFANLPRYLIIFAVSAQVTLLYRLHKDGMLKPDANHPE